MSYKSICKILKHSFRNRPLAPPSPPLSPYSNIIRVLAPKSWPRNAEDLPLRLGRLDRKVGGLDRAWTAFGRPFDALGQRLETALTRLGQRLAASWTGLDSDWTALLERGSTALWEGRGGKRAKGMFASRLSFYISPCESYLPICFVAALRKPC